jgi:hypothetical protein
MPAPSGAVRGDKPAPRGPDSGIIFTESRPTQFVRTASAFLINSSKRRAAEFGRRMRRKIAWRRIEQPFKRKAFSHLSRPASARISTEPATRSNAS